MTDLKEIVVKHKELRGKIDAIIQEVKQLPPTRETNNETVTREMNANESIISGCRWSVEL